MAIIRRFCPRCGEEIKTERVFSVSITYGNKSIFHEQICKECIQEKYDIDDTNMKFKMFLIDFRRSKDLSSWQPWKSKDIKEMIKTMQDLKIPIIKYDQELWGNGPKNMFIDNVPMKLMEEGEKILFKDKDIEIDAKEQQRMDRQQFEALRDSVLKSLNEMGSIINRKKYEV